MEIRLEKKGNFSQQVIFNTISGEYSLHENVKPSDDIMNIKFSGLFDFVGGKFLALYKNMLCKLVMVFDRTRISVDDEYFKITYQENDNYGKLSIESNGVQFECSCDLTNYHKPSWLTYSTEEEDENFCLWLSSVLNSQERKQILLSVW